MTRILVVEDSPTQAAELRYMFELAGFDVDVARDGERGLEAVATADVVLSDVLMPGMNGYDLCQRAKAARPDLPVLLMTSLEDPSEIVSALECGADGFVSKSHGAANVVARVKGLLEARAAGAGAWFRGRPVNVGSSRDDVLRLLLATFDDVVRTNQELLESRAELARKNDALLRAQRQREELTALIVHDLKSPAAGIAMTAGLRLRKALAEDERRYWNGVLSAAQSITRMVMNLLDVSRSEEGGLELHRADVRVGDLLREVESTFSEDWRRRLALPQDAGPLVRVDREMIGRVAQNLVDNAFKHSGSAGRVTVDVAVEGGQAVVRVRDEGPGVPEKHRARVFEKYVRLDGAEVPHGRGLGLAFCKMAVEAHGGTISVEDNAPRGACFVVRLPVASSP